MKVSQNTIMIIRGVGTGAPLAIFVYFLLSIHTGLEDIYCGLFGIMFGIKAGFWAGDWRITSGYHKDTLVSMQKLALKKIVLNTKQRKRSLLFIFIVLGLLLIYGQLGWAGWEYFSHKQIFADKFSLYLKAMTPVMACVFGVVMYVKFMSEIVEWEYYSTQKTRQALIFIGVMALMSFSLNLISAIFALVLWFTIIVIIQYAALCVFFTLIRISGNSYMAGILEGVVIGALAGYLVPVYSLASVQLGLAMLLGAVVGVPIGLLFNTVGQNKTFIFLNAKLNFMAIILEI